MRYLLSIAATSFLASYAMLLATPHIEVFITVTKLDEMKVNWLIVWTSTYYISAFIGVYAYANIPSFNKKRRLD
jgi:hypothetical protein